MIDNHDIERGFFRFELNPELIPQSVLEGQRGVLVCGVRSGRAPSLRRELEDEVEGSVKTRLIDHRAAEAGPRAEGVAYESDGHIATRETQAAWRAGAHSEGALARNG